MQAMFYNERHSVTLPAPLLLVADFISFFCLEFFFLCLRALSSYQWLRLQFHLLFNTPQEPSLPVLLLLVFEYGGLINLHF